LNFQDVLSMFSPYVIDVSLSILLWTDDSWVYMVLMDRQILRVKRQ
jgi:hypothetical protein